MRRWALYAILVVINVLILASAFGGKVGVKPSVQAKDLPVPKVPGTYTYLPLVSKSLDPTEQVTMLAESTSDVESQSEQQVINVELLKLAENSTSFVEREADQQILHIVGEVENQSGKHAQNIMIAAKLFDRKDLLLMETQGNLMLESLPNGTTSCFDLAIMLPEGFERYELTLGSAKLSEGDAQAVESYITNARFDRDFGWYAVNGVATYQLGNISGDVAVAATYYDKNKRVIGCELTFANFPESEVPEPGVFSFYYMASNAFKVTEAQTLAVNVPLGQE